MSLQLTIKDNGVPSRSSTAQVIITVNDENDNAPQFTESFYRINIPARDIQDGADPESLFRVFATDRDSGSNAEISYYIREGNTGTRFTMAPTTGVISTNKPLVAGEMFDISVSIETCYWILDGDWGWKQKCTSYIGVILNVTHVLWNIRSP